MFFFYEFFKGIVIGCAIILPGISAGMLCMVMGMYDKILDSLINFFKQPIKSIKYLLPLSISAIVGILLTSNILIIFLNRYELQTNGIFTGLILGSINYLNKSNYENEKKYIALKESNKNKKIYKNILIYTAFIIAIVIEIIANKYDIQIVQEINYFYLFVSGLIIATAYVVPGISSTVLLSIFGIYEIYILAIARLQFQILIPYGIGLLIGGLIWCNIIKRILNNYKEQIINIVIGFSLGTLFEFIPKIDFNLELLIFVFSVILGLQIIKILMFKLKVGIDD